MNEMSVTFRSDNEAIWATWFTHQGYHWHYEPQRFVFLNVSIPLAPGGMKTFRRLTYTPDFYLPDFDCYIECKTTYARGMCHPETVAIEAFAFYERTTVHHVVGSPDEYDCLSWIWYPLPQFTLQLQQSHEWYDGRLQDNNGYVARESEPPLFGLPHKR